MEKVFVVQVSAENLMARQIFYLKGVYNTFEKALDGAATVLNIIDVATIVKIQEFEINSYLPCKEHIYTRSELEKRFEQSLSEKVSKFLADFEDIFKKADSFKENKGRENYGK